MMRVRTVSLDRLAECRKEAWVDSTRSPYVEGDHAWIPVKAGFKCTSEIPERHRYKGRGFFMIGDVAVIHGERPAAQQVDEIVQFRHPRGVLWIDSLENVTRTPKTELLWGNAGEVCHRESGFVYHLDPQMVMFAQGNRVEKQRMAMCVKNSPARERVADMFAGIGYFTVPMAGNGALVHAMEINPVAFEYMKMNIDANNLVGQVKPELGDCRTLLAGEYDRVVMGHFDSVQILPVVMNHIHPGSVIHVHSVGETSAQIVEVVEEAGFSATIEVHKVKKYRPHQWHMVQDVTIS